MVLNPKLTGRRNRCVPAKQLAVFHLKGVSTTVLVLRGGSESRFQRLRLSGDHESWGAAPS